MYLSYLTFNDDTQEYNLDFGSQQRVIDYYNDIRQWASDIDWTIDLRELIADGETVASIAREYAKDGADNWDVHNGFTLRMTDDERAEVVKDLSNAIEKQMSEWLESEDDE